MISLIFIGIGIIIIGVGVLALLSLYNKDSKSNAERIDTLYKNKITTDMNPVAATSQRIASKARTDLINQLNEEAAGYAVKEQKAAEHELAVKSYNAQAAALEAMEKEFLTKQQLIDKAFEKGWDVATYLEIEKMIASSHISLQEEQKRAKQMLEAGFIYQMQGHQHLLLMTQYINGLYEQSREYEKKGKHREKKLIEEHIIFMEGNFREKQGLLQAGNEQDNSGSDEDTDLR